MTARMKPPILLVDLDAVADMGAWESLAEKRRWSEFYSHIPDATVRNNTVFDFAELAKAEGCWVTYSARWDGRHRDQTKRWLEERGFPKGSVYMRMKPTLTADEVAHLHARTIAAKAEGRRCVLVVHADRDVVTRLREKGVAAVHMDDVPTTTTGALALITQARPVEIDGSDGQQQQRSVFYAKRVIIGALEAEPYGYASLSAVRNHAWRYDDECFDTALDSLITEGYVARAGADNLELGTRYLVEQELKRREEKRKASSTKKTRAKKA